jgi:hypothetical protein
LIQWILSADFMPARLQAKPRLENKQLLADWLRGNRFRVGILTSTRWLHVEGSHRRW